MILNLYLFGNMTLAAVSGSFKDNLKKELKKTLRAKRRKLESAFNIIISLSLSLYLFLSIYYIYLFIGMDVHRYGCSISSVKIGAMVLALLFLIY